DYEVSIWAPLHAIGETIHRRICPLYTFDNRNRIHIAGSGVPFRAGEFRFLLTAAHVCFDSSKTPVPLFTMGSERPRALCGRRGAWEYIPGKTPDIDLSVIALYPAERNSMSNKSSIAPLATHLITGDIRETAEVLPNKSNDFHFVLGH